MATRNALAAALLATAVVSTSGAHPTPWQALPGLQRAMERYETLDREVRWLMLPSVSRGIRAGDSYRAVPLLRRRLIELGDLAADGGPADEFLFTQELADALRRFQARHGLEADGVLGAQTLAELNVPPSHRVRQLQHAIKAVESVSATDDARSIVVAVPLFRLWAWRGAPWQSPLELEARTIVGAQRTPTPELTSTIQSVTFRPYWTVPVSITRGEIVPAIRRDAGYLERHRFEIVGQTGGTLPYSAELLPRLASGDLRLRQRPGPSNALGLVRFDFPNPHRVFLHDTAARQYFTRTARALSHGCIRVEDPARLAVWVLNEASWNAEAVDAAFAGPDNLQAAVVDPVRIHVIYLTAMVTPDGTLHFGRDIYRRLGALTSELALGGRLQRSSIPSASTLSHRRSAAGSRQGPDPPSACG